MVLRQERRSHPLPEFTGHIIKEVPDSWRKWGVPMKDKKRIQDHLTALRILKGRGLKGPGIIDAYHTRRVAPLMRHALPLHMMAPGASLALSPSEVVQRIKEEME